MAFGLDIKTLTMIIIALLLTLIVIGGKLFFNIKKWKNENYVIFHTKEWWIMVACLVPSVFLLTLSSSRDWWGLHWIIGLALTLLTSAGMLAAFIWFTFDGFYNLLRGFSFFYLGTDDKDDAKSDNFLQRLSFWQHIIVKLGTIIVLTTLYYVTY